MVEEEYLVVAKTVEKMVAQKALDEQSVAVEVLMLCNLLTIIKNSQGIKIVWRN